MRLRTYIYIITLFFISCKGSNEEKSPEIEGTFTPEDAEELKQTINSATDTNSTSIIEEHKIGPDSMNL